MTATAYLVTGMTCEHCVKAVTSELGSLRGVFAVTVDLVPDGRSRVTVSSESRLPDDAVTAALDEAGGYQITPG
jgi:copper chaperone